MSLDVHIKYREPKKANYFLDHPYTYSGLSDTDKENYGIETNWSANITHNLGNMADQIPVTINEMETTLSSICWRPEEIFETPTTDLVLEGLLQGVNYMLLHRKELLQYESPNGWGTYEGFMKFLLNYKQACEDNPDCEIEVSR